MQAEVHDQPRQNRLAALAKKVLFGLIIAASFSIWFYAWSGKAQAERLDLRTNQYREDALDLFDDSTFAIAAEKHCTVAKQKLENIPTAAQADTQEERADQVHEATQILETMLDELQALPITTERDKKIIGGWLTDWEQVLEDRNNYENRVRNDPAAQYLMSKLDGQERLDRRVTRLAKTNDMPSCEYPTDAG